MEFNREQVVKSLEKWMKNYDGKVTNFATLGSAIGLIEKLDDENQKLKRDIEILEDVLETSGKVLVQAAKLDTVRHMRDKLTAMSEFYLHADRDCGLLYIDFCDWFDEVTKEILGEE